MVISLKGLKRAEGPGSIVERSFGDPLGHLNSFKRNYVFQCRDDNLVNGIYLQISTISQNS